MIEVVKSGLLTTVQDLGRPGYAHLGVARSGALDAPALIRANRLVGNPDSAAGLETTLIGVTLRAEVSTAAAVTGARAVVTIDGEVVAFGAAFAVRAGEVVEVGSAEVGVRTYVAFAGGVSVASVLGSRSTDTLSGLGPPPLRPGFVLPVGRSSPDPYDFTAPDFTAPDFTVPNFTAPDFTVDQGPIVADERSNRDGWPLTGEGGGLGHGGIDVRLRFGPRHDWFSVTARDALLASPYTLSVKSNRVGARLAGTTLTRAVAGELPSEGIVLGAVQVPSDGQPLVFLADHPTTGGYPVIGVVDVADLPLLAQARPGTVVRFVPWT